MADAAEGLRNKIMINRVCRQVVPTRPLMEHSVRQRLASDGADLDAVTAAMLDRLMNPDELRMQIKNVWQAAASDVASHSGDDLLAISPGEEVLNAVFMRFVSRRYNKRYDGLAIARAMPAPPEEIRTLLDAFMLDEPEASAGG